MVKASLRQAEYQKQRDQLWTEVQAKLNTMSPAEREKVGASLTTLKKSIAEIEAALGRDPANALLQELLVSSCQEEMRVLTTVRDSGRQEL
jgi:N-acyl-D-aspartate/D-glutamate deacylase